ncbi:MAG: DUF1176 domain-containing protein [Sphingomonas sp.]
MHRTLPLLACAVLAACSSTSPDNSTAAPDAPTNTIGTVNSINSEVAPASDTRPVTPKPSDLKTFGNWTVGCDNTERCTMESLGPEDGSDFPAVNLGLTRDAGPAGALTVTLQPNDMGNGTPPPPASIAVDGKPVGGPFGSGDTPTAEGDAARAIATAMANGHTLTVRDKSGKTIATLSLQGASAALRYIDAQQGRANTETAIVATGSTAAGKVPPPPAAPQITAVNPIGQPATPPQALLAHMQKQAQCDVGDAGGDLQKFAIGGDTTLLLVPCGHGAYNMISAVYVMQNGKAAPARMDAPSGFGASADEQSPVPQVINADFAHGVLTSTALGRGLGDCGVEQQFVWDGSSFRLSEQSQMGDCRGNPNYITTWRARVARR